MNSIVQYLWLIPLLPLVAAAINAMLPSDARQTAARVTIGTMGASFLISVIAFFKVAGGGRVYHNFDWFSFGNGQLQLGWLLDPLSAAMLMMVTFVGLCIFVYSVAYMAHDARQKQFFTFLSLFAAAMLGLIISNSLLLLFMCWEVVGLASYLLIGFWFEKPSAAAACKKAFITTRIGDIGFLLGIAWLAKENGSLLFYDDGRGFLEQGALEHLNGLMVGGMTAATAIGLLLFCGAMGKSGQVPLHVWLPDAMEGPTPVSALIHAATMVAAGVFLIGRVHPLMTTESLNVVAGIGALTAVIAALIGIAQTDIKRILAYSTVSQLGYMMLALGVGGLGAGIFHLITHGFFKALLFLGAGSVIHGCHGGQDIRAMGGLRGPMRNTFVTYAIGMMALSGFPLLFSGFWSKEAILHAAHATVGSHLPFYAGLIGAVLTAFYMTRLMALVFFGTYRGDSAHPPHESPSLMTVPLKVLAVFAIVLGFFGTPAWPWFTSWIEGREAHFHFGELFHLETLGLMVVSTLAVGSGVWLGWRLYFQHLRLSSKEADPIQIILPRVYRHLENRLWFDELYEKTIITWTRQIGQFFNVIENRVWIGAIWLAGQVSLGLSWLSRSYDEWLINDGFDKSCETLRGSGKDLADLHRQRLPIILRTIGAALLALLVITCIWFSKGGAR